jgi:hypothetical protein
MVIIVYDSMLWEKAALLYVIRNYMLTNSFIHSFISNLSDDRSTASSKTIPPLNAI